MSSDNPLKAGNGKLTQKLDSALRYARRLFVLGACNKYDDFIRTGGWSAVQRALSSSPGGYSKLENSDLQATGTLVPDFSRENSIFLDPLLNFNVDKNASAVLWYYSALKYSFVRSERLAPLYQRHENPDDATSKLIDIDPVLDPKFKLTDDHRDLLMNAMFAEYTRHGSCYNYSAAILEYLWRSPEGIHRMELMCHPELDHVFLVINRSGSPEEPSTWGEALIVDGWYKEGIVYPASEYESKIKEITEWIKENNLMLEQVTGIKVPARDLFPTSVLVEVNTTVHKYPTEDPMKTVKDYYVLSDNRFLPIPTFKEIDQLRSEHKEKMQAAISDIRKFREKLEDLKSEVHPEEKNQPGSSPG